MDSWMGNYVLRISLADGVSEMVEKSKVKHILERLEKGYKVIYGDRTVWSGSKWTYVSLG